MCRCERVTTDRQCNDRPSIFSVKFDSFTTPIDVRPGDELRTKCSFNSQSRNTTTVWGESSQQEMCFGILYYSGTVKIKHPFQIL